MARVLSLLDRRAANGHAKSYQGLQEQLARLQRERPDHVDVTLDLMTAFLAQILDRDRPHNRDAPPLSRDACLARIEATLAAIARLKPR